jgi:hypothetical protein
MSKRGDQFRLVAMSKQTTGFKGACALLVCGMRSDKVGEE